MPNLSELKTEIASVTNIGKITNAMELVATAKLKRVQKRAESISSYVSEVYALFNEIIINSERSKYLKDDAEAMKKTFYILINSNLGLCGGYNANINRVLKAEIKKDDEVYAIGTKAIAFCKQNHYKIRKQDIEIDENVTSEQTVQIAREVLSHYNSGEFDEVKLCYTKFVNTVTMEPTIMRVFPIVKAKSKVEEKNGIVVPLTFEPDPETVLETSVSLYLNTLIYGSIIESKISEQASRRVAMEAATKNGKELKSNLSLLYNRSRQAAITQEITEIVSGANA